VRERRAIAIVVAGAIAAAAGATAIVTPACTTHKCDTPPLLSIPSKDYPEAGFTKDDPNRWESNPLAGTWINYGPDQDIIVNFDAGGRLPNQVDVYISQAQTPIATFDAYALATGNVAELVITVDKQLSVRNHTCEQYYVRIIATFTPPDAGAPLDAATE
jgi:hypothetical protein